VNCRECAEFLIQFVSGELPEETRAIFLVHLSRCRNCEEYLRQYQDTIVATKMACDREERDRMPALPEELVRAILAARKAI
jgi:anti-sigma factor RsiW